MMWICLKRKLGNWKSLTIAVINFLFKIWWILMISYAVQVKASPLNCSLAPQVCHGPWFLQFLGKKARKAKSWLKQLSTTSEEMDLTEHDLIYFGLEKRIRMVFFFLILLSTIESVWLWKVWIKSLQKKNSYTSAARHFPRYIRKIWHHQM